MSEMLQPAAGNPQAKRIAIRTATPLQLDWLVAWCEGVRMEDVIIPARGNSLSLWLRDASGERTGYYATGQFGYTNPNTPNWMYPIMLREGISILRTDRFCSDRGHIAEYAAFLGSYSKTESIEHEHIDPSYILSADEAVLGDTPLIAAARLHALTTLTKRGALPEVPINL